MAIYGYCRRHHLRPTVNPSDNVFEYPVCCRVDIHISGTPGVDPAYPSIEMKIASYAE